MLFDGAHMRPGFNEYTYYEELIMPSPFVLKDTSRNISVESVLLKVDEQGAIYYEISGKNSKKEQ